MKVQVDPRAARRLRPGDAVVSCRGKDRKDNALVVGVVSNVSLDPVIMMIGVMPERFSHDLIRESGCFVINLPGRADPEAFRIFGSVSGRDCDKIGMAGCSVEKGTGADAPLLAEYPVNIECRVIGEARPGSHTLFFGEVTAIHANSRFVNKDGRLCWEQVLEGNREIEAQDTRG